MGCLWRWRMFMRRYWSVWGGDVGTALSGRACCTPHCVMNVGLYSSWGVVTSQDIVFARSELAFPHSLSGMSRQCQKVHITCWIQCK
jgi:hypothetical protein